MSHQPLSGLKVLDFSTLLPGPLCTLLLAEAGADVLKVEKLEGGDDMRSYTPRCGDDSVNFGLLNREKRSIAIDLKSDEGRKSILSLVNEADVLVEQFRPGVMNRLGLGFEALVQLNPRLIYCSITGYGQSGPKSNRAAHDLNYMAESGLLGLTRGSDGAPVLPPVLVADIAGGAYPAMMNILLALRQREADGQGRHLDVSMSDNLFTFAYWGLAQGLTGNGWPRPAGELVTGGTARYQIYCAADGQYLAAAPLENKFWRNFVNELGLPELSTAEGTGDEVKEKIASVIRQKPAAFWLDKFAGVDACVARVVDLEEAMADQHFQQRGIFSDKVRLSGGESISALPVPVDRLFRAKQEVIDAPGLGADAASFQDPERRGDQE
ncbi:alpha-methylacyl-CoA racemase (plasmid) [Caballeronia sp. S22]